MRRMFIAAAFAALAALVIATAAQASVKWNVRCEKIAKLPLRKGDCAHTLQPGRTWTFPKGVLAQKDYTLTGQALSIHPRLILVGGHGAIYYVGGYRGSFESRNKAPYRVTALGYPMIVVATTSATSKAAPSIKLIR